MTPPFWTLDRIADALGDGPRGPTGLRGVTTDTRAIAVGDAFVALRGERFDAHDFVADAVRGGASALVVEHPERTSGLGVPVYAVDDTLVALGALAAYRRKVWGRPVVAVAGSNGKTSTKELVRSALGAALAVHATQGNLNNRIGTPLTLLALPDDADIAVIELGTNTPGEIAMLREIIRPDIAIVTSIAEEHLEGLGDLAGVLREESAVYDRVDLAIAPAGQPEIAAAAAGKARRVLTAGLDAGDVRPARWGIAPDGLGWVEMDGVEVRPPLRGEHNLRNLMLALACASQCGISIEAVARAIAVMPVPAMRMAWESIGSATLINDAYNSNPGSARAALELLERSGAGRQRVAVLGTMRELGPAAGALHEEIARRALDSSIELVAGVGDFAEALDRLGDGDRVVTAEDPEALWPRLAKRLAPDAVILLKASRGVRLERLVPHLTAWATR
ncbi:MAG TPA: UDP-N-acetylmuramoyl-tripeptide--D-alanyl-D-alanine ligase [Gemmatimonadaceae bacterium]|nr:UDP-N-acetylmuramoyl-tripeptide--D-alanyl-D-alanine ligase [Gemmatimonadaceae bacterium]